MHVCAYMCIGQRSMLGVFLYHSPPEFDIGSRSKPEVYCLTAGSPFSQHWETIKCIFCG